MKKYIYIRSLKTTWLAILAVFLICTNGFARNREDKFLIIHMDGLSSETLFAELEAGSLPNIAKLFAGGEQIKHGVTVFPGETPLIVTRLKKGLNSSEGAVGWAYVDRETNRAVGTVSVFLDMMSVVCRPSRSQFVLQYPVVNHLA